MKTLTLTDMRKNLFRKISDVIKKHEPVRVLHKNDSVIIMNETDYENLLETIHLLSDKRLKSKLKTAERQIKNGDTYSIDDVFK
jgi:antitoxin YefM